MKNFSWKQYRIGDTVKIVGVGEHHGASRNETVGKTDIVVNVSGEYPFSYGLLELGAWFAHEDLRLVKAATKKTVMKATEVPE